MFFLFSAHHYTFPQPKIEYLVMPVKTLHPMKGIRKREPEGRKTKSVNNSFIKIYGHKFKFVEAPLIQSFQSLRANQVCKAPFTLPSQFSGHIHMYLIFFAHTKVRKTSTAVATEHLNFLLQSRTHFQNWTKLNFK